MIDLNMCSLCNCKLSSNEFIVCNNCRQIYNLNEELDTIRVLGKAVYFMSAI